MTSSDLPHLPLAGMEDSIRETVNLIDRTGKGIALVVDGQGHLIGTVTDGDIRRAILVGLGLNRPIKEVLAQRAGSPYSTPLSAPLGTGPAELRRIMREASIRQLPLLDDQGRVSDLATLQDLLPEDPLPLQAAVMAGGYGRRLRPLTNDVPKPMLPLNGRPVMEHTIDQLRVAGINRVSVTTHYRAESIKEHFGDGRAFGVEIDYVSEDRPLGTAGALALMEAPEQPMLVINGDILTRVNFQTMLAFHREHEADLTVAVRRYDVQVPYGLIEADGVMVMRVREKPQYTMFVNAGIYLLEPGVHGLIPKYERFDMTDLIELLLSKGRAVVSFPIIEYWLDIGELDSYKQAQADLKEEKVKHWVGTENMCWSRVPEVSSAAI